MVNAFNLLPPPLSEVGPTFDFVPVAVLGAIWLVGGIFMHVAMVWWEFIKPAAALLTSLYLYQAIVYVADIATAPSVADVVSLAAYIAFIPIVITLASIEIDSFEHDDSDELHNEVQEMIARIKGD